MTTKFISGMGPKSALIAPRPLSSSINVQLRASDEPSKNMDVSSAYCEILNSLLLILMPFIFLFCLILTARNSAHIINI